MVSFDLTDTLYDLGLPVDLKTIQEFRYSLQKDIQQFVGNVSNLTVGLSPSEGVSISNLPEASFIRDFINDALLAETAPADMACSMMYYNHVFNLLVSIGYIPLGWIYQAAGNVKTAQCALGELHRAWDFIISYGEKRKSESVYTKAKSFGLMVKDTTMGKKKILWYLVTSNQQDCDLVQLLAQENKHTSLMVYNENDYDKAIVESSNRFLFQFDRIIDTYMGIVFRLKADIKSSIPTYLAMIGCDKMCVIEPGAERSDYQMITPQYVAKEYKRSQPIDTTIRVPSGYMIDFVSLDGTPYFVDTVAMTAAGIEVVPMDETTLTGYTTYKVTVSGQSRSVRIYVDACQDFTGIGFSRQVISTTKTKITIGDTGVTFSIVFNFPFIFFNADKVHVFAKKDDETPEEEVLIKQVMIADTKYVEKSATFGAISSSGTYPVVDEENNAVESVFPSVPSCGYPYPHVHHEYPDKKYRDNPFVIHYLPPYTQQVGNGVNGSMDTTPEARVMMFNVSESGSIIVTFDGYTDYKYFRVTFDDRAAIIYVVSDEVIPVIEDVNFVNPNVVTGCTCGGDCSCGDNCTCGGNKGDTTGSGDEDNPESPKEPGNDGNDDVTTGDQIKPGADDINDDKPETVEPAAPSTETPDTDSTTGDSQ